MQQKIVFLPKKNHKSIHYLVFKIQIGNQNANLENSKSQKKYNLFFGMETTLKKSVLYVLRCCRHLSISWKCSWAKNPLGKTLSSFWSPLRLKERLWEQKKALKGSWAKNAPNLSETRLVLLNYSRNYAVKKIFSQLLFANGFIVSINRRFRDGHTKKSSSSAESAIMNLRTWDLDR